jgi:hypothetical protein
MRSKEDIQQALDSKQQQINDDVYTHTLPYPYCCVCFNRLTVDNIYHDSDDVLHNVCINCKDK